MAKNKIKKNVEVKVIAGSYKGTTGKVLAISKDGQRVTVDKVNIVKKHNKPTQQNPDGGIQEFEAPIHISNVKLFAKKDKKEKKAVKKDDKTSVSAAKAEEKPVAKKVVKNDETTKDEK